MLAPICTTVDSTHELAKDSVIKYARHMTHTDGIESFGSMLKEAHEENCHRINPKCLNTITMSLPNGTVCGNRTLSTKSKESLPGLLEAGYSTTVSRDDH